MTTQTNIPSTSSADSSFAVRKFFDNYFNEPIYLPSNEVDAVVGFFRKRDFDSVSANAISIVLLQQSKIDNVNIFELLDTLKGLSEIQLSAVVAEILNYNREKTSALGFRQTNTSDWLESRNILL